MTEAFVSPAGQDLERIVEQLQLEAEFWRVKYEEERERVGKLWVAYKDLEEELRPPHAAGEQAAKQVPAPRAPAPPTESARPVATQVVYEAAAQPPGPFTYRDYALYRLMVPLKGGRKQMIYFFSRRRPRRGEASPLPEGYLVSTSPRTSLPFLRRVDHGGSPASSAGKEEAKHYQAQCAALTAEGQQCRNSSRKGSHYCASHENYHSPTAKEFAERLHTSPRNAAAPDTSPAILGAPPLVRPDAFKPSDGGTRPHAAKNAESSGKDPPTYRPQCAALAAGGAQCRNLARERSRYCASHRGYHPKSIGTILAEHDTKPRIRRAPDVPPVLRAASR